MSQDLLTLDKVTERIGFKRSKIYAMVAAGTFPAPIKIGAAARWPSDKIDAWIADQVATSETSAA